MSYSRDVYKVDIANMVYVNELLDKIQDWDKVLIKRHVKFVEAYLDNNKNLEAAGRKFYFTKQDMLRIFWRIQKQLHEEYQKRLKKKEAERKRIIISRQDVIL
jgi:hypothetical protein